MNKLINFLSSTVGMGIVILILCTITILIINITMEQCSSLDAEIKKIGTKTKIIKILLEHKCPNDVASVISDEIITTLSKKE